MRTGSDTEGRGWSSCPALCPLYTCRPVVWGTSTRGTAILKIGETHRSITAASQVIGELMLAQIKYLKHEIGTKVLDRESWG